MAAARTTRDSVADRPHIWGFHAYDDVNTTPRKGPRFPMVKLFIKRREGF